MNNEAINTQNLTDDDLLYHHLNFSNIRNKAKIDNFRFKDIQAYINKRKLKCAMNKLQYLRRKGYDITISKRA